jgi:tyrosine-protein kinase Etk/Wzc
MKQPNTDKDELIAGEEQSRINLKKRLLRMIRLWPWFVLSLVICLLSAFLYLRYATPVYQAVASLMVKDERKGEDLMINSALKEIGLGGNAKLVENEIEVLRSYDLMEAVVDSLQLFVSVKNVAPVKDVFVFGDEIPFTIKVINPGAIKKSQTWMITDTTNGLLFQRENDKRGVIFKFNDTCNFGNIKFLCIPGESSDGLLEENANRAGNAYKVKIYPPDEITLLYSNKLSVDAASKQATVINLGMKDTNKKRAAAILQALILIYNKRGVESKNKQTENTIEFLNRRLDDVAGQLKGVEGTVGSFKSENKVTDLSNDAQQYLASSQQVDAQKAQSQTQLNIINALERDLLTTQDNPKVVPSSFGIQDASLEQLISKHNDLVLQKEKLEQRSGPKNPLLIDQQNQIKELRSRLLTNVRNLKQAYTISLNDIALKDEQLSSRIRNVPQLEKKLVQITRNQNVQEQVYAFLLQKKEEAEVSRASAIEDSRTIVSARGLHAVSPKTNIIWALSALIGLMLPIGLISLRDFMDNKVGDDSQIQQRTDLPVLGMISHVKKLRSSLVIEPDSRSAVAEQIRNIRTAISFTKKGDAVKSILVTSFQLGDGKSFTSVNLAAGYALLNKKTVILEFDLRRPHISTALGIDTSEGISSILSGKASADELLIEIPGYNNNLFLLPAGHLPPNPAELISGPKMSCLIKNLQERFDHIIIDTPPFTVVTDAALLQQYADITLIILRQGYTSRDVYTELKRRFAHNPDSPTYLVLNDVGKRKHYRYDYGYRYGKGYYHEKK